jgi:acetyl-CoA carboxylase biotin carboxyl carrier protein
MRELKELIEFLAENKIGEFDLERNDLKVRIKFAQDGGKAANADLASLSRLLAATSPVAMATQAPAPVAHAVTTSIPVSGVSPASEAKSDDASLHIVKSPIVGTFYESPAPGTPAFVKVGDKVEMGKVLCIVEAMKLMNEIESDATGEIVKCFVTNGRPIEYGQQLFAIRPV